MLPRLHIFGGDARFSHRFLELWALHCRVGVLLRLPDVDDLHSLICPHRDVRLQAVRERSSSKSGGVAANHTLSTTSESTSTAYTLIGSVFPFISISPCGSTAMPSSSPARAPRRSP
jgi:hypothetical protein